MAGNPNAIGYYGMGYVCSKQKPVAVAVEQARQGLFDMYNGRAGERWGPGEAERTECVSAMTGGLPTVLVLEDDLTQGRLYQKILGAASIRVTISDQGRTRSVPRPHWEPLKRLLRVGVPMGLQFFSS